MGEIGVADAARNNAEWCDAVCSAHGGPGEFFDSHWLTRAPPPPRYPSLVTLGPALAPAMAGVRALEQARPFASWAVKDSFGVLPLERAGFRLLFGAEWIVRPAARASPRRRSVSGRWYRVQSESALSAWEEAWGESLGGPRVFLPALLRRSEIAILAFVGGGDVITAGVVANRSGNAVGVSNLFADAEDGGSLRAECIEAVADAFPGLPLVGYEAGRDLAESYTRGFSALGSLRVWVREPRRAAQTRFAGPSHGMEPEEGGPVQVRETEEDRLVGKLRKIEALFARATSAGERAAAESARDRIRERLEQIEKLERAVEYRFSLPDGWSKSLFIALLRRYGIKPYRYSGQRRTTVMARVTRTFADEVLWPEFQELNATLRAHLESVTTRVIAEAIHGDQADVEERPGQEPKARAPQGFLGPE